jgi:hypothetical protein
VVVGDGEEGGSFEAWPAHGWRMGREGNQGKSSLQRDRQFYAHGETRPSPWPFLLTFLPQFI